MPANQGAQNQAMQAQPFPVPPPINGTPTEKSRWMEHKNEWDAHQQELVQQNQLDIQKEARSVERDVQKKEEEYTQQKHHEAIEQADLITSIPPLNELKARIDKSMEGKVERFVKGTAEEYGIPTEASNATQRLIRYERQLKTLVKGLAGAGAISDKEQAMLNEALPSLSDPTLTAQVRKDLLDDFYARLHEAYYKFPDVQQRLEEWGKREIGRQRADNRGTAISSEGLPRPGSRAEVEALPSGTEFMGPDGQVHVRH
jgi:hypothetical protein